MKGFNSNKKNVGATSIASKACAWILSIMLVVTGMAPSFAANSKNVSNGAADSYVKNVAKKDEASSKKLDKKDTSATKKLDKKLSFQKILKDTNNENAKKKIFKNRRNQQFNLNASGNVNATLMNGDLSITVKNSSGDANIDRSKWIEMVKALGGSYDKNSGRIDWSNASDFGRIYFPYSSKVYLPKDSSTFFYGFKKHSIYYLENCKIDNVENMESMFANSKIESIDLSKWELNDTLLSDTDKTKNMFASCSDLGLIKTPVGLKTDISGVNNSFKIVKLKKGEPVTVEKENQNLNSSYKINQSGDKNACFHIYHKDKYVGVTFNSNGGDVEAWINHAIVEKGKFIFGTNPKENPKKEGHWLDGWSLDKNATSAGYLYIKPNEDITVYAIYKHVKVIPLNDSGNVYVLPKVGPIGRIKLEVNVRDTKDDVRIQKNKWREMTEKFHTQADSRKIY